MLTPSKLREMAENADRCEQDASINGYDEEQSFARGRASAFREVAEMLEHDCRCDRCGRALRDCDAQHGTIPNADESGDGMRHNGGCDVCCICRSDHAQRT